MYVKYVYVGVGIFTRIGNNNNEWLSVPRVELARSCVVICTEIKVDRPRKQCTLYTYNDSLH